MVERIVGQAVRAAAERPGVGWPHGVRGRQVEVDGRRTREGVGRHRRHRWGQRLVLAPGGLGRARRGDKLLGGAGHNRGRRNASRLVVGDAVDWWRVERLERGRLLRLRAEMKVPGGAWLELTAEPSDSGGTIYRQRAIYMPRGLAGKLYWWAIFPFHGLIFPSMAKNIIARAAQGSASGRDAQTAQ